MAARKKSGKSPPSRKSPPPPPRQRALQDRFLAALQGCGIISEAARISGVSRTDHYRWLRDEDYRHRFLEARETALDMLELEAWNRARAGSDRLLMFLLSAYRPRFRADAPLPAGPLEPELAEMGEPELLQEAQTELRRLGYDSLDEAWSDER